MGLTVRDYALSKGLTYSEIQEVENDHSILMKALKREYGYIAGVFKDTEDASIISLDLRKTELFLHELYFERVEAREPVGNMILGILVEHSGGYRLIDGYHRLKWARNNDLPIGNFIFVE